MMFATKIWLCKSLPYKSPQQKLEKKVFLQADGLHPQARLILKKVQTCLFDKVSREMYLNKKTLQ